MIDFQATIPTKISGHLREAAAMAAQRAIDPLNVLDNNPFISREWLAVSTELHALATKLDRRLEAIFEGN